MKRLALILGTIGVVGVTGALAAPNQATLMIRHQVRGCHAWAVNGGAFRAAQTLRLAPGAKLTVIDNDVMPHKLVQVAGPKAKLIAPAMRHMSARAYVTFSTKGTYRFTTKAGEDYMKGMKTTGPDKTLRLTVFVR